MKTISELQQEIRGIRKDLDHMDARLAALDEELLNYKDAVQEDSIYVKIFHVASAMPEIQHPVVKKGKTTKASYYSMLFMIATREDSINVDQLLFLQRMILSDREHNHLENFANMAKKLDPGEVIYYLDDVIKDELGRQLILDMMLISILGRQRSPEAYGMIADVAAFMKIPEKEIKDIAMVSKIIASQKLENDYDVRFLKYANDRFDYYLNELAGWKEKIQKANDAEIRDWLLGKLLVKDDTLNQIKRAQKKYWSDWAKNN